MTNNEQNAVKKCPVCGQYSGWDETPDATCQHCGSILDPRTHHKVKKEAEKKRLAQLRFEHPVFWVSIKPTDKPFTVFWKQIARGAQIVYMAIVSFLVWLAAVVAG